MAQAQMGSRIVQSFHHFLHYYQVSQLKCGIIIARADMNEKQVDKLKSYVEKNEPNTGCQISYDKEEGLLGILLDDCSLGYTHFYALHVQDFLREQRVLNGGIMVGSFPENSDKAEEMLFGMLRQMIDRPDSQEGIRIYQGKKEQRNHEKSILIVDSDRDVQKLLKTYFNRKGYQVTTAGDGKEGLERFEGVLPSLVITEINLSAIGGYSFINQVKSITNEKGLDTEVMVLTNKQLEEDIKRTFEYGVAEYITKPFSLVELEARVKRLVNRQPKNV
ncbi:response regulator transcription factor [Halobacillus litoralis]|uniref:response regulator transcription factor n=1 Tax=Halobacillus litoralis TaxID=45668 RepID=UPI001CD5D351|nr:response regulator transcription factor [Halobacillus litoralis]MCA0971404.1 response regulator transcription factor [Halobacillus litoralis]